MVVVVTWHAATTVAECLDSIPDGVPVVVIDNASADGTVELVRGRFPRARVVANDTNRGFAAAANQGLGLSKGTDYVLLLNPDARLDHRALGHLTQFCEDNPRVGLASALVVDQRNRPEIYAAGREPSLPAVLVHELGLGSVLPGFSLYAAPSPRAPVQRPWVAATCLLARMRAVDEVGRFDSSFFLYCEDIDWCRRMRERGWQVWVVPEARAVHLRSASVATAGPWIDRHRIGSMDRYFARRHGRLQVVLFRLARWAGAMSRAAVFGAAGRLGRRPELIDRARQRRRDASLALRPGVTD